MSSATFNPAVPGASLVSDSAPSAPSDIHLQPHGLQHQPSTQSLSPSVLTTTPDSAAASIHSTDPIDVEKALPIIPAAEVVTPKAVNSTSADILPDLSTLVTAPTVLSAFLDKILGPKDRKIWNIPRNTFIAVALAGFYVLLAMILGIGIGYMPYRRPPGYNPQPQTDPTSDRINIIIESEDTTTLPLPTSGTINTGEATYYNPALGSCGITNTDNDPIVAISMVLYDAASVSPNPNLNPLCGKKIRATRYRDDIQQNITIEATVVDRCVGCAPNDLDLSPYLFEKIAHPDLGRVDITWAWI